MASTSGTTKKKHPPTIIPPNTDFAIPTEPKQQANILLFGDAGTGKTTFVTEYAPDPVAFINFDRRAGHACYRAVEKGRRILYTQVDFPANLARISDKEARVLGHAALDKTMKHVEVAVRESEKGNIRTICLDTGTEYGELAKLAFAGRIDKVDDYGKSKDLINRQVMRLFSTAREGDAHLVVLGRAQPEPYVGGVPTGKYQFRGNATFTDAADWAAHLRLARPKGIRTRREFKLEMEITKAGIMGDQTGEVYTEEEWGEYGPFVWASLMNYGGTPEDWE